jgi:hypothetical protein
LIYYLDYYVFTLFIKLFDNYFFNRLYFFRLNQQITQESFLLFGGLMFRHFSGVKTRGYKYLTPSGSLALCSQPCALCLTPYALLLSPWPTPTALPTAPSELPCQLLCQLLLPNCLANCLANCSFPTALPTALPTAN